MYILYIIQCRIIWPTPYTTQTEQGEELKKKKHRFMLLSRSLVSTRNTDKKLLSIYCGVFRLVLQLIHDGVLHAVKKEIREEHSLFTNFMACVHVQAGRDGTSWGWQGPARKKKIYSLPPLINYIFNS
jgi:hypothetical protein